MKRTFLIIAICFSVSGFSQAEIKISSIDSGGANAISGSIEVSYTLGEIAINEISNGAIHISEGFLGKHQMETLGITNTYSPLKVKVYPNPVIDEINIEANSSNNKITILNANGSVLNTFKETAKVFTVNMKNKASGVYFIAIQNDINFQYRVVKVIKK